MNNPPRKTLVAAPQDAGSKLVPAVNDQGLKIRGLWRRGGKYYAQIVMTNLDGTKGVSKRAIGEFASTANAEKAFKAFKLNAKEGQLRPIQKQGTGTPILTENGSYVAGLAPTKTFKDLASRYLESQVAMTGAKGGKSPSTMRSEKSLVGALVRELGNVPLRQLTPGVFKANLEKRFTSGDTGPRTANHELTIARNIAKYAVENHLVTAEFTAGVKFIHFDRKVYVWPTAESIQEFCAAAKKHLGPDMAQRLINFIWFLAYAGARKGEALLLKWTQIDWRREQVVFSHLDTKSGRERFVDFNEPLKSHLLAMKAARDALPENERAAWLFPSASNPQVKSTSMSAACERVEKLSGLKLGGFHNLRRYFASWCVMNNVDYMTTAAWMGHADRGVLVAKVYARLNSPHTRRMATLLKADQIVSK